jgi:hypothetical protein
MVRLSYIPLTTVRAKKLSMELLAAETRVFMNAAGA